MKKSYDYKVIKAFDKSIEEDYNEKNKELDKKLQIKDQELLQLQDNYYEEKLTKLLDKDKLIAIAKENFKYSLYVNSIPLIDDQININSKNLILIFEEKLVGERNLPLKVEQWGSLTGGDTSDKFYDYLSIKTNVPYEREIKLEPDGKSTAVYYTFKDIPGGTIITIKLSEVLRERLNRINNVIEIMVPNVN